MISQLNSKEPGRLFRYTCTMFCLAGLLTLNGCLSPMALDKAALAYNQSINEIRANELLLNIARVRHHHPIQFTTMSSVAATFSFQMNAGAVPPLGAITAGQGLSPIFGTGISENPTITIIPVNGDEFNQRVLSPYSEHNFFRLYQQGEDIGLLIRMMASELRADQKGDDRILRNIPRRGKGYEEFRRRVLHLTALNHTHHLFVAPIVVQQTITFSTKENDHLETVVNALETGYRWAEDDNKGTLSRNVAGRIIVSNYDVSDLTVEERNKLFLYTNALPNNEIFVDIRPGSPGGDYPFHGVIRLRAFLAVLEFLGRGISEEVEFPVEKDARTGEVRLNPVKTMEIEDGSSDLGKGSFSISYEDRTYSILNGDNPEAIWNLEAFRLLGQLYELSVHSTFSKPPPAITIAK